MLTAASSTTWPTVSSTERFDRHSRPSSCATLAITLWSRSVMHIGNQNYPVPDGLVVEEHHSIVIYCKPFQVVFSVAPLVAIDP